MQWKDLQAMEAAFACIARKNSISILACEISQLRGADPPP